jgi:hypothetical protein
MENPTMKLTKQQIKKIIQEELQKEGSCGGMPQHDAASGQMMQQKAMDIIMAMQPEELAQLLQTPMMQMAFERVMGMGKY